MIRFQIYSSRRPAFGLIPDAIAPHSASRAGSRAFSGSRGIVLQKSGSAFMAAGSGLVERYGHREIYDIAPIRDYWKAISTKNRRGKIDAATFQGKIAPDGRQAGTVAPSVIASAAKQSRGRITRPLDCFVARAPRNDGRGISVSNRKRLALDGVALVAGTRAMRVKGGTALKRVKTLGHRNPCARRGSIRLPRKEVQWSESFKMRGQCGDTSVMPAKAVRESGHPDLAAHAAALDSRFRGNDSVKNLILNDAAC